MLIIKPPALAAEERGHWSGLLRGSLAKSKIRRHGFSMTVSMSESEPGKMLHSPYVAAACVGGLLLLFAVLSFTAVMGKSATYDEPLHVVGGESHRQLGDFRINPEDPALFGWWSTLPHLANPLLLDPKDANFEGAAQDINKQWWFVVQTLYSHGAEAADAYLNTSRFMFVLLGVALGALISLWAYQLGGGVAAIAACVLFSLDPNMLAHSALVKNDVPLSMFMCLLGFCTWRFGRHRGGHSAFLLLAAFACALALNVKFSAVLFFPMLGLMLLGRALMAAPWTLWRWTLTTRLQRIALACAAVLLALVFSYIVTWAMYGFRYSATASGEPLGSQAIVRRSISNQIRVDIEKGVRPDMSPEEMQRTINQRAETNAIAFPVRVDLWMQAHHILPEGWLFGFLYTYATTLLRSSFLMGAVRERGWWYYFPAAMLFKTPTATLLAMVLAPLALLLAITWLKRKIKLETEAGATRLGRNQWTILALTIAPGIYFIAALSTNLNLGLRHILPVYPYLYVALGWIFSLLWRARPTVATVTGGVIAVGLLFETVAAYPNYLAFFNTPSGGSRGGLQLLGDSNLDWGQDLKSLVQWQHEHPADHVYFAYFGMADPGSYSLDYVNLPGGYPLREAHDLSATPGVVAISATNLQGIYWSPQLLRAYKAALHNEAPIDVINGTIYLYRWPPTPEMHMPPPESVTQ